MKKKKEMGQQEPVRTLNREHINAFKAIAENKKKMKFDQEAISDDVKVLAEKLGWPTKRIGSVVSMLMKEEEQGGALQESSEIVESVEQILGLSSSVMSVTQNNDVDSDIKE